jgi:sterol desaturase/sphingolipid hydroxylase (fatty acid hydroxylase superfamily)
MIVMIADMIAFVVTQVSVLKGTIAAEIQWILDYMFPNAGLYGVDANKVIELTIPVATLVPFVFVGALLEQIRPIEDHDNPEARATIHTEWMLVAFMATFGILLHVLVFIVFGRAAAAIGGPLLYLDAQSVLGSAALVVVFALYVDCAKYWMHRLSHMIPFLWAVHSFHHSAERLTVATGARHHWVEIIVLAPFYFLTLSLFQVPEHLTAIAVVIAKMPDAIQHLNYKIAWHRVGLLFNTPWWHRIHHSADPKHYEKNFSVAFPIMDVIFGTAYRPEPDEYPETGLMPRENPNFWRGIIWPFRGLLGPRFSGRSLSDSSTQPTRPMRAFSNQSRRASN